MDGVLTMDGPLITLRLTLLQQGCEPIPVVGPEAPGSSAGKRPGSRGWQAATLDPDVIRFWSRSPLQDCTGTGRLVGVDIDVLEEALATALQDLTVRLLRPDPAAGHRPSLRCGRPRLARRYRDEPCPPGAAQGVALCFV